MINTSILLKNIYASLDKKIITEKNVREHEAKLIFENITGHNFLELLNQNISLNEKQQNNLENIINSRNMGKPLAYVLREISFRNLDLYIDERVLIPRQETELLVEIGLGLIENIKSPKVLEIGIGSGAISLSIVQENKNANVYASDVSADAIQVAKLNMSAIGASSSRLEILEGNLFEAFSDNLKSRIDLVISNPPYIGLDEKNDVEESVLNYEPHLALFSGEQGDEIIDKIIKQSRDWLNDNGTLLMEISPRHEKHIREFVQQNGFSEVNFYNDLTNRLRFVSLSF